MSSTGRWTNGITYYKNPLKYLIIPCQYAQCSISFHSISGEYIGWMRNSITWSSATTMVRIAIQWLQDSRDSSIHFLAAYSKTLFTGQTGWAVQSDTHTNILVEKYFSFTTAQVDSWTYMLSILWNNPKVNALRSSTLLRECVGGVLVLSHLSGIKSPTPRTPKIFKPTTTVM